MRNIIIILLIAVIAIGGFLAFNKYQSKDLNLTNTKQVENLKDVNVRLKWLHQTQFAGNYVADQKGFYKKNGLNVTLLPFRYETPPIDEVINGKADFGITGADELLIARENGAKIKALAVIYRENPVVAYAFESSKIKEPKDFVGKKVGIENNVNVEFIVRAMVADQDIEYDKDFEVVKIGYDAAPLINGEVDIATGYITNEPLQAEKTGKAVTIISPYKYGVSLYADVIFAREDFIEKNPEIVKKFVQATLEGWEYSLKNIDEAVKMTLMYKDPENEHLNFEHQKKLLEKSIPLIKPTESTKIGQMNYVKWVRTYELLRKYDLIKQELDIAKAYTTEFLN